MIDKSIYTEPINETIFIGTRFEKDDWEHEILNIIANKKIHFRNIQTNDESYISFKEFEKSIKLKSINLLNSSVAHNK